MKRGRMGDTPSYPMGFTKGMQFNLPRTVDAEELLDAGVGTPQDVQASLDDLWRINRYMGGITAVTRHLYPYLLQETGSATVLDVATGSGQIAAHIAAWARKNRRRVQVYGLDIASRHLNIAAKNMNGSGNHLIQADALQLPLPEQGVDYLISSLFVHHLVPTQVVDLLKQLFNCARKAIIISDVERGWFPLIAFKIGQPVFARSYLTQHDGPVSIRRAYTQAEFHDLAIEAGLTNAHVYREFPWRMTLVAEKQ
jgi:SAM-dependent methyltransferase